MALDYVALGILIFAAITLFYGIIVIHDIPYEIAVHRNHPHQDAIHYAGWVSLFTLHAIWPFLWIWSTLYREDRGWGFQEQGAPPGSVDDDTDESESETTEPERVEPRVDSAGTSDSIALLTHRMEALEDRIARIEQAILAAEDPQNGDAS